MEHTKGKWRIAKRDGHSNGVRPVIYTKDVDRIAIISYQGVPSIEEAEANAQLIAAAPDRYQQLLAIIKYDWSIAKVSLYDEEGIEGWRWMEPDGQEHVEVGSWDDLPPWPDSARQAITKAEKE